MVKSQYRVFELFRTTTHPLGWSEMPDYTLRADHLYRVDSTLGTDKGVPEYQQKGTPRQFFRLPTHPEGYSSYPDYEIRGSNKIYRTLTHPDGWSGLPDYEIW